jgi:hypothetical protein
MEINVNVHEFIEEKMSEGGDVGDLSVLTFDDIDGSFDRNIIMKIERKKYLVPTKELAKVLRAFT